MQKSYINALYELMKKDSNVCSLLSDSGTEYDEIMFREFPNQCFNFGIAEENKVSAASGMAAMGKIPFVYTTGAFLAYRSYEFIRDDVCLQKRNVKIIGMGSGLSWSTLGSSHHTTEDIAVLRVIPNLTILSPASPLEVKKCVEESYKIEGPVYIRTGMSGEKEIYNDDYDLVIGKNIILSEGVDALIFTTGSITAEVLEATNLLAKDGISVKVINIVTLKPFDEESVRSNIKKYQKIFTVEEHSISGGLGSIIAELVTSESSDCTIHRIGVNNCFAKGYGTHKQLLEINGLDSLSIYKYVSEKIRGEK